VKIIMANEFEKIATDVGHGLEKVAEFPKFVVKAAAVVGTAIKDQPQVKEVLTTLVSDGEAIIASGALDIAGKGLNLINDAATLALVEAYFAYIKSTVIPMVETIYGQVKADVSTPVVTA
jgi:hypothetical protein